MFTNIEVKSYIVRIHFSDMSGTGRGWNGRGSRGYRGWWRGRGNYRRGHYEGNGGFVGIVVRLVLCPRKFSGTVILHSIIIFPVRTHGT